MVTEERAMEVIPIGEPGCYATPGHVDLAAFTDAVKRETAYMGWRPPTDDEWADDHGPARHTWMVVKNDKEHDHDIEGFWYREVTPETEDAEPYTLIPVIGYWLEQPS